MIICFQVVSGNAPVGKRVFRNYIIRYSTQVLYNRQEYSVNQP